MSLKSRDFFLKGTHKQFEFVLGKYQEALRAKAEAVLREALQRSTP